MKTAAIGIALLALAVLPALPSEPVAHAGGFTCSGRGQYIHWSDRLDPADARLAITTEDGGVTLLLTDRAVVMQLSDRTMRHVHRELKDAREEQDNVLASVIATVVTGTVREALDSGFLCRVRDLRDVTYEDGRLVFIARNGRPVFENVEVNDTEVTEAFSEKDARRFVREFRRVKTGQ
jgi:hypothetical protein